MAGGTGFGLLKSIIDNDTPLTVLSEKRIDNEYFSEHQELEALVMVRRHRLLYGSYPTPDTIQIELGDSTLFNGLPEEPVDFWVDTIRDRYRRLTINNTMRRVRAALEEGDTQEAIDNFGNAYTHLRTTFDEYQISDFQEGVTEALAQHDIIQNLPSIPGIPFGFPYFDSVSGGAQPGDTIIIGGGTGVGKTYLVSKMGHFAYRYDGKSVLMLSTEMPKAQMWRRLLGIDGQINAADLKRGEVSHFVRERIVHDIGRPVVIDGVRRNNFFKLLPGGIYSKLIDIEMVTTELAPDMLILDGASLIRIPEHKGSRWDRIIEVIERLKALAMRQHIPILATYHLHADKKGNKIYGGQAMSHFASLFFTFQFERAEDLANPSLVQYRKLKLEKGRDGESGEVRVLYDMGRSRIIQDAVISGYAMDFDAPDIYNDPEPLVEI